MKQYDTAIQCFETHIKIDSQNSETHFHLAQAWQQKNNIEKAKAHYQKAIEINATYMPAYQKLIPLLRNDQAITICKQGLKADGKNIALRKKLIEILIQKNQLEEALKQCNTCIKIQPLQLQHQIKKAQIFTLQNKLDQAIEIFKTILKIQPNNKNIQYNIAHLSKKNGQYEKAIHLLRKIEGDNPKNPKIMLALAQSYLSLGYYKQGWQYMHAYNNRKQINIRLQNIDNIAGKIILIQAELNCNQTIQLIRYAKLVKDKGAKKIVVQSPNQLIKLLEQCPYIDEVISSDRRDVCPFHKLVQLSSLPYLFDTTLQQVPCEIPYLFPEKEMYTFWQQKLQKDNLYKIGVYITKESGIPIEKVMDIAQKKQASIYFLNNIANTNYLQHIANDKIIHHFGKGFTECTPDIVHLSALLPQFDLVICCDSLVAHLAGALAVPTCIILPKVTDWQWSTKSDHTPWYPTIQMFRQEAPQGVAAQTP